MENRFLNLIGMRLRKGRPLVKSVDHTVWSWRGPRWTYAQIWFRTRGCRHSHTGGCTMCDYWASTYVPPKQMVVSVEKALSSLESVPGVLVVSASGSIFDDWEVPPQARHSIFQLLTRFRDTTIVFETRADTLSEEKIIECKSVLDEHRVFVEMGLESADPWIQQYCVNKGLDLKQFVEIIRLLKKHNVGSTANVLVGIPFLTAAESVEEAVSSVNWAFRQGIDSCVLFPVNVKPWTLIYWLKETGMYVPPSLWALVEVLIRLKPQMLPFVDIAWYKARSQPHPEYRIHPQSPTTCPRCHGTVAELLDQYAFAEDRERVLAQLAGLRCECRELWNAAMRTSTDSTLYERVRMAYRNIGEGILGSQWWAEHEEEVLSSIQERGGSSKCQIADSS